MLPSVVVVILSREVGTAGLVRPRSEQVQLRCMQEKSSHGGAQLESKSLFFWLFSLKLSQGKVRRLCRELFEVLRNGTTSFANAIKLPCIRTLLYLRRLGGRCGQEKFRTRAQSDTMPRKRLFRRPHTLIRSNLPSSQVQVHSMNFPIRQKANYNRAQQQASRQQTKQLTVRKIIW